MSTKTTIEWTDRTWNPITGCSEVSPGCANCYAARLTATRLAKHPGYAGLAVLQEGKGRFTGELRFHADRLEDPLHWRKPSRVFVNSMSDLFHERIKPEWIPAIFKTMIRCRHHTFQVLTKRPAVMQAILSEMMKIIRAENPDAARFLSNVWLGVSVENQRFAVERIPLLLETPAAVRFLSAEPLLGPIDFIQTHLRFFDSLSGLPTKFLEGPALDWVICGGESGPNARPMHPEWALSLRDQCAAAGVPFFFKQWGSWLPVVRHGFRPKNRAGALHALDRHQLTECGEVDELLYYAYPSDANDDHGPYWEMTWAPKHHVSQRYLDDREWNEFPVPSSLTVTVLRAEQ